MSDLFGVASNELLDTCELGRSYRIRIESIRDILEVLAREVTMLEREIRHELGTNPGYLAIQSVPGVGEVLGAVFCAEIGDVSRFSSPAKLASWAGLTPKHRESDVKVHRGQITKQGSRIVRWAAVEAAQRQPASSKLGEHFNRIATSHGAGPGARKIARTAVARKIVTLVYYGLRDGVIRSLAEAEE